MEKTELLLELKKMYDGQRSEAEKIISQYDPWVRFLKAQYNKVHSGGWNQLSCTTGLPRSGKSVFTAFTAWLLDRDFSIKDDIVYTDKQFTERLSSIRRNGENIIWDEAGVGLPAREWYKIQNREISKMLQTVGYRQPFVWFVTPDATYIDSQPRKLFHYFFECFFRAEDYVSVKVYKVDTNRRKGDIYYSYPRFRTDDGLYRLRTLRFYRPPLDFIHEYIKHSVGFKDDIQKKGSKAIAEDEADIKSWSIQRIQEYLTEAPNEFTDSKQRVKWQLIHSRFAKALGENSRINAQALSTYLQKKIDEKKEVMENERRREKKRSFTDWRDRIRAKREDQLFQAEGVRAGNKSD